MEPSARAVRKSAGLNIGTSGEHKEHTDMKPKNTICLWFDKDAHEAARALRHLSGW